MNQERQPVRLDKAEWFKGSLATWLLVLLIPMVGWFMKRMVDDNFSFHANVAITMELHGSRITKLEAQVAAIIARQDRIMDKLDSIESLLRTRP